LNNLIITNKDDAQGKKSVSLKNIIRGIKLDKIRRIAWSIVRLILVLGISYIILYPTIIQFSMSFMERADMYDASVKYIPKHYTLQNIKVVYNSMDYLRVVLNTFVLCGAVTFLQMVSCTLVGYGLARFNFKFKGLIFAAVILTIIVPPQAFIISQYLHFRYFDVLNIVKMINGEGLNLLNSFWPFMLLACTCLGLRNGIHVFIMRQYFRGMPKELEESALVDGANTFKTFYKIMLPHAIPPLITVLLFSFVWQWNDAYFSYIYLPQLRLMSSALFQLPYYLTYNMQVEDFKQMADMAQTPINPMDRIRWTATGSLMSIAPLLVMYAFCQRYFVESVERAGIVG